MDVSAIREARDALVQSRSFRDGFVLPDYTGLNTTNICSVVGSVFGNESLQTTAIPSGYVDDLKGVEKLVVLILDGFGYNRLLSYLSNHEGTFKDIAEKGVLKPITTTFPSTTATALTSIFTGAQPAQHNIVGYHMFSKSYGLVFSTLQMKPVFGYNSRVNLVDEYAKKVTPWMTAVEEQNVKSTVVTKGAIAGSGLSRIIHRNQPLVTYQLQSDMFAHCKQALKHSNRTLLMVYYGGVDTLEHRYGPYSEEVTFEINALESSLRHFADSLTIENRNNTLIIITSDHGVAEAIKFHYIKDIPEVNNRLALPPIGDTRAAFLFIKPGEAEAVKNAFEKRMQDIKLISSAELIEKGAFGHAANMQPLKENIGEFAAISAGLSVVGYPYFEDDRYHEQMGAHGGLTAEEMIVPLLSVRLSKL